MAVAENWRLLQKFAETFQEMAVAEMLSTRKASSRSWLRPSTPHIAGQTGRERDKPPIKLSQGNPPSFRGTPGQGRSPSLGTSAKYLALGSLEQRKGVPSKGRTQRQRPQAEVRAWMSGRQGHPGTICKGDARQTEGRGQGNLLWEGVRRRGLLPGAQSAR